MSSTLLSSVAAYKCDIPEEWETIYTLVVNTAERNVHPISYHHWPINTGRQHEIMTTLCNMASDIYSGNLHWRRSWGKFGVCSEFMIYGENVLKRAKEITGPVPDLDEYHLIYFKPDDPCADILLNFTKFERFDTRDCYDSRVLFIRNPTIEDVYRGKQIRDHYETCKKYAMEPGKFDEVKFRKILSEWCYMMPDRYREVFKTVEKVS